jgi:hypothetical protein
MNEENKPHGIALSIRQPWAWLIMQAGKDIENRNWPTKVRGRVLIHASKGMTAEEWRGAWAFAVRVAPESSMIKAALQNHDTLNKNIHRGGIIGSVEIVDCVNRSASPWFMGDYGFVLRDPQPLPFYPCRGQLGFFKV